MDLQAYAQNRLIFLSGVYLEYTKKILLRFYGEWWCIRVYILKYNEK